MGQNASNLKPGGLWRHGDFLRLWSGQTISILGSMIGGTALSFTAILFLEASPFEMGLLNIMQMAPAFLIGLFAGAWVDRLRRKPLLIAADLGRALALATIPLAAVLGGLGMGQLYAVALVVSMLGILFELAYQAYLPALVGKEAVMEGNSKLGASSAIAEFAGFSAGGWLVQLLTAPFAILIDTVSFLFSAVAISSIRVREGDVVREHQLDMRKEIAAGVKEVLAQPFLRGTAAGILLRRFSGGIFGALVVLYMSRGLGFEPGVLAMTWAVGGLSSFAGAALAPAINRRWGAVRAMIFSVVVSGILSFAIPVASGATALSLALLILAQLGDGFDVIHDINLVSTRQKIVAERLLGRVTATMEVLPLGAALIGSLAGGLLGETLGVRGALFLACGMSLAGVGIQAWMLRGLGREVSSGKGQNDQPNQGDQGQTVEENIA